MGDNVTFKVVLKKETNNEDVRYGHSNFNNSIKPLLFYSGADVHAAQQL